MSTTNSEMSTTSSEMSTTSSELSKKVKKKKCFNHSFHFILAISDVYIPSISLFNSTLHW